MTPASCFSISLKSMLQKALLKHKIGIERTTPVYFYLDVFKRHKCYQGGNASNQIIKSFKNSRLLHPPLTSLWQVFT